MLHLAHLLAQRAGVTAKVAAEVLQCILPRIAAGLLVLLRVDRGDAVFDAEVLPREAADARKEAEAEDVGEAPEERARIRLHLALLPDPVEGVARAARRDRARRLVRRAGAGPRGPPRHEDLVVLPVDDAAAQRHRQPNVLELFPFHLSQSLEVHDTRLDQRLEEELQAQRLDDPLELRGRLVRSHGIAVRRHMARFARAPFVGLALPSMRFCFEPRSYIIPSVRFLRANADGRVKAG